MILILDPAALTEGDRRDKGHMDGRDYCCAYHEGFFDGANAMAAGAEALVNGPDRVEHLGRPDPAGDA
jgi:hypothetical protein